MRPQFNPGLNRAGTRPRAPAPNSVQRKRRIPTQQEHTVRPVGSSAEKRVADVTVRHLADRLSRLYCDGLVSLKEARRVFKEALR